MPTRNDPVCSGFLILAAMCLIPSPPCRAFILLSHSSSRLYEAGQTYTYDYFTTVTLDEPNGRFSSSTKNVGYQITADVHVQSVWQNPTQRLLQISLDNPYLFVRSRKAPTPEGFAVHSSGLSSLPRYPLYVVWSPGNVSTVFYVESDSRTLVNMKKGIASLFQYELTAKTTEEVDTSGLCQVSYLGDAVAERVIVKKKRSCRVSEDSNMVPHPIPALSADVISDIGAFYTFTREEAIIEEVKSQEKHSLHVHAWKDAAGRVMSDQHLKLTGTSKNAGAIDAATLENAVEQLSHRLGRKLVSETLQVEAEIKRHPENYPNFDQLVDRLRDGLGTNMTGTIRSASFFLRLLVKAREETAETLAKVLRASKNKPILPVLIDVMAGAQAVNAHKAAMAVLDFKSSKVDLVERYLWAVAVTPHPPEEILADVFRVTQGNVPSEKLGETLLLSLASLAHRFCNEESKCQKEIVIRIRYFLRGELKKCKELDCKLRYLRALSNLRSVENVDLFLRYIEKDERKVGVAAAKALQMLPLGYFDSKSLNALEQIYAQLRKKHDSTVQAIAADILLRKDPPIDRLAFMLSTLSEQDSHELRTFVAERIRDLTRLDPDLQRKLSFLLADDTKWCGYNLWAQRGRSTAFTRYLYDDVGRGSNGTFVAAMELGGGMIKRIKFDVNVGEENSLSTLLTLGVFARGLHSFSNKHTAVDPEDADESATAGFELSLLGSQLRPFVFFSGAGELMGHLWSGTASSRTPALQGTYVLHDHRQKIPLSNGVVAELSLLGGVSLDLGGQIEMSLWYKTAHSVIDEKAAFVIRGYAVADTPFVESRLEFSLAADSELRLNADSDFSDKTVMCMRMSQPELVLKHKVRKWEHIVGQKHKLHKSLKRMRLVPGRTFVMNQKNSQLCNVMFGGKS
ncbi:unnamed protein product [Notodromas monacha]|uniref:Vitellogenin domain-containing protein n=1 Tax=Notodromas monacha TaxID=399045 RepID=A0A7R9BVP3_9CRUS|nr:unnamed protein product [Notodromas monacha]CAG0920976.1 unnamed protein product [Notodromas monacha]